MLQLADSAFPAGGFAHSAGPRGGGAARRGPGAAALRRFCEDALSASRPGALPSSARPTRARRRRATPGRRRSTRTATPSSPTTSRTAPAARRGAPSRPRARASSPSRPELAWIEEAVRARVLHGHHAPLYGAVLQRARIGAAEAQRLYLHQGLRGVTSAAVRLGLAGPARSAADAARSAGRSRTRCCACCADLPVDGTGAARAAVRSVRRRRTTGCMRGSSSPEVQTHRTCAAAHGTRHAHDDHHDHPQDHEHERAGRTPGLFQERERPLARDYAARAFTVGIGGPVGSGKTALVPRSAAAARRLPARRGDQRHLHPARTPSSSHRNQALLARADPRGGDRRLPARGDPRGHQPQPASAGAAHGRGCSPSCSFVESGGDNLAAQYSRELVDYTIYVIDVAGGDKVPRKGGPGIAQSGPAGDQQDRPGAARRRRPGRDGARRLAACAATARSVFAQRTTAQA